MIKLKGYKDKKEIFYWFQKEIKKKFTEFQNMKLNLQEINDKLEKISEEHSKLFDQEQELNDEKYELLAKDICDHKYLNRCKWKVKERYKTGFILRPIYDHDDQGFDDIQAKLRLYPHGSFELNENIELCGDDGGFYIMSSDTKAGIEFIKSQYMEIVIDKSIIEDITSMEKQIVCLKEFINQFGTIVENNKEETDDHIIIRRQ